MDVIDVMDVMDVMDVIDMDTFSLRHSMRENAGGEHRAARVVASAVHVGQGAVVLLCPIVGQNCCVERERKRWEK